MGATVGHPAKGSCSLRALAPLPVDVRPAPAPLTSWRVTGSSRHPLARYLHAMPRQPGGPAGEVVVLGGAWSRDAAVTLLSAAGRRTRWVTLVHTGAGGGSLLRGFAAQRPGLSVRAIEIPEPTTTAVRTAACLLGGPPHAEGDLVVHGAGAITATGWRPVALPARTPRFAGMTVLVTGGLGDLGVRTAAMLARLGAVPVLADVRAPEGAPDDVRRYLEVIRRLAPDTRTVRLDLRDPALVAALLAGLRPQAIVHCAGRIAGGAARDLGADDVQALVAAKVDTLRHVVRVTGHDGLRAVLAFGSVTARGAHPGLYGYALANELLRREVARLAAARPLTRWCTAEWSLWSGAGMARHVARAAPRRLGMVPVPVLAGTLAAARLVGALTARKGRPIPQSLVIAGEHPGAEGARAGRPEGLPGIDASMAIPPGSDLSEAMLATAGAAMPGARLAAEDGTGAPGTFPESAVVRAVVRGDAIECSVLRADPVPGAPLRRCRYWIQPES